MLKGYWPYNDYDVKELKSKYFKIELADMSNEIVEKLFEQIFGHTLKKLKKIKTNFLNKMNFMIGWSNQVINILI